MLVKILPHLRRRMNNVYSPLKILQQSACISSLKQVEYISIPIYVKLSCLPLKLKKKVQFQVDHVKVWAQMLKQRS